MEILKDIVNNQTSNVLQKVRAKVERCSNAPKNGSCIDCVKAGYKVHHDYMYAVRQRNDYWKAIVHAS